jgi:hypothetical protein
LQTVIRDVASTGIEIKQVVLFRAELIDAQAVSDSPGRVLAQPVILTEAAHETRGKVQSPPRANTATQQHLEPSVPERRGAIP